jgi:hypothetical protein
MPESLEQLIEKARLIKMSASEREAQRRSFAYGNANIENNRITRDSIKAAANQLAGKDGEKH